MSPFNWTFRHAKEMKFSKIEVRTDSKFCISALDVWIIKWKRFAVNGKWTKFDKSPIIHQEIFEEIDRIRRHNVDIIFRHVKGHNGELGNEQADKLGKNTTAIKNKKKSQNKKIANFEK
jgi:ribonuclease HI